MKTAISVPDDVFSSADALAAHLGVSRSELYSTAVAEYLAKHQHAELTAALDRVYSEVDSGVDPTIRKAQGASLPRTGW